MAFQRPYFEKLVLGHNSFFGVDHLSSQAGQQKESQFSEVESIVQMVRLAHQFGAGGMMMSTHERAKPLTEALRSSKDLNQLAIYPLLPYAQKYVTAANEKGILNVIFDMISGETSAEKFKLMWNGTKGVLGNDIHSILKNLIQIELKIFKGLNTRAIFLHDIFTDLILALNLKSIAYFYCEEIEKSYGCKAAFATKNLPLFLTKFSEWGLLDPLVMPHINERGYWMNPSQAACEKALSEHSCHVMAMSTLASGYLAPEKAFTYIKNLKHVESVVIGASKAAHIQMSFSSASQILMD